MRDLLRISGLTVSAGGGNAVNSVSLDVKEGEIVGIVGESGCGKSLTALSIPRLHSAGVKIIGGEILFENRDLLKATEHEMRSLRGNDISMVFQDPGTSLNPLLKVRKQLVEPLILHGITDNVEINERINDALIQVDLTDTKRILQSYPHELSGGMRQRVMIARAIVCCPKLLIADEPTTALDVAVQAQILNLLRDISAKLNTAVLIISHDLSVIRKLSSRVYVMYAGRIVEHGTSREIMESPEHEYTRGLINSLPSRAAKGKPLAGIPGRVPNVDDYNIGCTFAPRCKIVCEACENTFPEQRRFSDTHYAFCHKFGGAI